MPLLAKGPIPTLPSKQAAPRNDEFAELADAVVRGDANALRAFLTVAVPVLLRVVRRVLGGGHPDLEDVTYEAAYAVVESLPQFRGQGTVRHFACRIAVLTAMNVRRREGSLKRARTLAALDPEQFSSDAPGPETNAQNASLAPVVRELVFSLSETLAETLTLHVILGYTISEIAETSGVSHETVRSRLRLAKQALRKRVLDSPILRSILEVDP